MSNEKEYVIVFNTMRHYSMIKGLAIKEKSNSSIWWKFMKKEFKRISKLMIRISREYVLASVNQVLFIYIDDRKLFNAL